MNALFTTRNRRAAEIARALLRFAPTDLTLLLEGETGVGKSFVAARAHRAGRRGRPFVVVDCGAVPATLLASALFGHRAGAFTDATRPHRGLLERAADGTLVLDRVDALPSEGQTALLRVLEERSYAPVGAAVPRSFRARVIALADAGLQQRVDAGTFRPDLYHRLAGFHAQLPALRHRPEDILPFARAVLRRGRRQAQGRATLTDEAGRLLTAYPWPGNFRELEAALTRARMRGGEGTIGPADLGLPAHAWPAVAGLAAERMAPLVEVERLYALWVLAAERGNVSRAAAVLGISRRTLIRWRRDE
ncbi:MAG TPA: sigma 54-interacting transcriptional regulator [Thermoanaerobaculaceae bacterium]|nr:sigma 54-interacting transcriptional regulator [Thermoanaerobaculaceae bacterium]